MAKKSESVLICWRIADCTTPHAPAVLAQCDRCKSAVWRALSSPETDRTWCVQCGRPELKTHGLHITGEQIAEIKRWLEDQK